MNSHPPIHKNYHRGHTPWRFYYQIRLYGERIRAALKNGPGYGEEVRLRYSITPRIYKKIVSFLAEHPTPVERGIKFRQWGEVEDIVFAQWGANFRRLPSYSYVMELLRVTCPEQFRRYAPATTFTENAMAGNAAPPPTPIVAEPKPPRIEAELPPEPETGTVKEIPAIQPDLRKEVQTEWAETNPDLLAVEILEPRLDQAAQPDPEPTASPTAADDSAPIPSEPAPAEPPTLPTGVASMAPPPVQPEVPAPVPHPGLTLEKFERWIRIGMAAEAYLTPAGIRRLLGEEGPTK